MNGATRTRIKIIAARLVCVLTLAGLVVAPCCATLCAGQACPQAHAKAGIESNCHVAGPVNDSAGRLHGMQHCGARQLPAANVTSANWIESLQKGRAAISGDVPGVFSAAYFSALQRHGASRGAPNGPPQFGNSTADNAVLRI